jgi:anti-sigma B factor antagonist
MTVMTDECVSVDPNGTGEMENRSVTVLGLPERFSAEAGQRFLYELEGCMLAGRPYLVLDCSRAGNLDKPLAAVLLHCLEEAMKRNGDVKLACLSLRESSALVLAGAVRLFEVFDTVEDAIRSFHHFSFEMGADASESAA